MKYLNMNLLRLNARVVEWNGKKGFAIALRTSALMFEIKAWAKRLKGTNTSALVSAFLKARGEGSESAGALGLALFEPAR
jgi:hypothetical protein